MKKPVLITLGSHCGLTHTLQRLGLKGPSGPFDWVRAVNLNDVCDTVEKMAEDVELVKVGEGYYQNNCYLLGTEIRTAHYTLDKYPEIFKRRAERFLEDVRSDNHLVFIRCDLNECHSSTETIERLKSALIKINPNVDYSLIVITEHTGSPDAASTLRNVNHQIWYNGTLKLWSDMSVDYINEWFTIFTDLKLDPVISTEKPTDLV